MDNHLGAASPRSILLAWARHLEAAFSGMTGESVTIKPGEQAPPRSGEPVWLQEYRLAPGAAVLADLPPSLAESAGRRVLMLAGLTESTTAEARNTFEELLAQSFSALAADLSQKLGREVEKGATSLAEGDDSGITWIGFTWQAEGMDAAEFCAGVTPALIQALQPEARPAAAPAAAAAPELPASKTIDLLLEVELPVSVSFGRSQMRLRELVKLGTGSIVELNRAITEPVEVIVNNCVIARGEVVVVEGNYGVRIRQIVSRQERLRSLF